MKYLTVKQLLKEDADVFTLGSKFYQAWNLDPVMFIKQNGIIKAVIQEKSYLLTENSSVQLRAGKTHVQQALLPFKMDEFGIEQRLQIFHKFMLSFELKRLAENFRTVFAPLAALYSMYYDEAGETDTDGLEKYFRLFNLCQTNQDLLRLLVIHTNDMGMKTYLGDLLTMERAHLYKTTSFLDEVVDKNFRRYLLLDMEGIEL